jgi:predicted transposase YdaD
VQVVNGVTTAAALDAAGLHVSDSPVRTLTVLAVTTAGSAAVGATHERRGEKRGRELGRQEGLDTGRRLGRATAMLEQSRRLRAGTARFGRRPAAAPAGERAGKPRPGGR